MLKLINLSRKSVLLEPMVSVSVSLISTSAKGAQLVTTVILKQLNAQVLTLIQLQVIAQESKNVQVGTIVKKGRLNLHLVALDSIAPRP